MTDTDKSELPVAWAYDVTDRFTGETSTCVSLRQPETGQYRANIRPLYTRPQPGVTEAIRSGQVWQPIETAPKDGSYILAVLAGRHDETGEPYVPDVCHWTAGYGWVGPDEDLEEVIPHDWKPTHWMPLQEPPEPLEATQPVTPLIDDLSLISERLDVPEDARVIIQRVLDKLVAMDLAHL